MTVAIAKYSGVKNSKINISLFYQEKSTVLLVTLFDKQSDI